MQYHGFYTYFIYIEHCAFNKIDAWLHTNPEQNNYFFFCRANNYFLSTFFNIKYQFLAIWNSVKSCLWHCCLYFLITGKNWTFPDRMGRDLHEPTTGPSFRTPIQHALVIIQSISGTIGKLERDAYN